MSAAGDKRLRLSLVALLGVFAAPVVLAYLAFFFWRPTHLTNYGDLIPPRLLADAPMSDENGRTFRFADLRGKWVLVQVDRAACTPACVAKLYVMRQVRLAQGDDQQRIERLWLVPDSGPVSDRARQEFSGTRIVRVNEAAVSAQFPAPAGLERHIFLVDPLGNLMMRYPPEPDASRVLKDLKRLLRVSQIG